MEDLQIRINHATIAIVVRTPAAQGIDRARGHQEGGTADRGQDLEDSAQDPAPAHRVKHVEVPQSHQGNKIVVLDLEVLVEKGLQHDHALNLVQNPGSLSPSPVLDRGRPETESQDLARNHQDKGLPLLTETEEVMGPVETMVTLKIATKTTCMMMALKTTIKIKILFIYIQFECCVVITF